MFQRRVIAQYADPTDEERRRLRAVSQALRPLTIHAIAAAYQESLDEIVETYVRAVESAETSPT